MNAKTLITTLLICGVSSSVAFAAPEEKKPEPVRNVSAAQALIDEIKAKHPPENGSFNFRLGVTQIETNTTNAINLNEEGVLPILGIEGRVDLIENLGLEIRGYYASNSLYASSTPEVNGTGAYEYSYDVGVRYTFILDETEVQNYFGFKVMSHTVHNNFEIINPDDLTDDSKQYIHMSDYQALSLGIERSFQITPDISLLASLDMMSILNSKSETAQNFESNGLAFQVRGEVFYRVDLFGIPGRVGGMYWQGAYTNKITDVDDLNAENQNLGRSSHVQSFRTISFSYATWF